jgi:hypothetical protein
VHSFGLLYSAISVCLFVNLLRIFFTNADDGITSNSRTVSVCNTGWSKSLCAPDGYQGRPLGGVSGALALGADFEGAPKRRSPTGHTLIRSTVAWWFPHLQTKGVAKDIFKFGCIGFSLFWCVLVFTYVYSCYALCLLLQILFVAALDIKTRDVPTVSSVNSLLSQYCKASHFFANVYLLGGGNCSLCPVCPMGKDRPWWLQYRTLQVILGSMWLLGSRLPGPGGN